MSLIKFAKVTINACALLLVPFWVVPADAPFSDAKTNPGVITADQQQVQAIVSKAIAVTNSADKVLNQLSVEPASKP